MLAGCHAKRCNAVERDGGRRIKVLPRQRQLQAVGLSSFAILWEIRGRVVEGVGFASGRTIAVTAEQLSHKVVKYELTAERLIEKTKDSFRDASDLAQTRVGRLRTIVRDVLSTHARRTVIMSTDDTAIDGKKVLLG